MWMTHITNTDTHSHTHKHAHTHRHTLTKTQKRSHTPTHTSSRCELQLPTLGPRSQIHLYIVLGQSTSCPTGGPDILPLGRLAVERNLKP